MDTLQQIVAGGCGRYIVKAEKLIWRDPERFSDPNKRGEVRLPAPADVVRIAPFAETATPSSLRVGDAKIVCPILQILTEHVHGNVLFWNFRSCHVLIGVK